VKYKNSLRREIKFKIFIKNQGNLYSWLRNSPLKKSYSQRQVNSLYYDTPNLEFAASNLSGESSRIKIRARWYNSHPNPNSIHNSFCAPNTLFTLELKRKFNNLSDKIIIAEKFLKKNETFNKRRENLNLLVKEKIKKNPILVNYLLRDIVFIGYNRNYYEHFECPDIRLTIDKSITCSLSNTSHKAEKISQNFDIVELKYPINHELKAKIMMQNFPARAVRSSKYIYAVSKFHRFSY
jgi:SPX domain protein involved in polyphosphate accumulation